MANTVIDKLKRLIDKVIAYIKSTFIGRVIFAFNDHGDADQAAALSYYLLFSFIPMILAFVSLLGMVGLSAQLVSNVVPVIREKLPEQIVPIITEPLLSFSQFGGVGITFVVGIVTMAWSASKYLAAFGRAMDNIRSTENAKPGIMLRIRMLFLTLILLALIVAGVAFFSFGETVANKLIAYAPEIEGVAHVLQFFRMPVVFIIFILVLALLYFTTPGDFGLKTRPKGRAFFAGAIVAMVLVSLVTVGFISFVTHFSNYDAIYGTLAGIIIVTFWFWLINCMVLIGAEVNHQLDINRGLAVPVDEGIYKACELPIPSQEKTESSQKKSQDTSSQDDSK